MSWFIGYIGENPIAFKNAFHGKTKSKVNSYFENNLCLFYDDNKNCSHNLNSPVTNNNRFIVCGIGISSGEKREIFYEKDWQGLLDKEERILKADGHFAGVSVLDSQLFLFTDPIGLRDIYYIKPEHSGIIFSTRIDLLLKFVKAEIDLETFGGRWLLYNQLSQKSIFKNIERIVCGSSIVVDRKTMEITKKHFNWLPEISDDKRSEFDFENDFASLSNIFAENINGKSLMLSGGLDSRVLLSLLIKNNADPFSVYTFGNDHQPDLRIAKNITSHFKLPHSYINPDDFYPEEFWEELKAYSTQTIVNNSVLSFLHLKSYEALKNINGIFIDGGFGEIWRREFLYKLSLKGKDKIAARDSKSILPYLKLYRSGIFNPDIVAKMENGCVQQIEEFFESLPHPEQIGIDNWLDLLAVKTRMPNYYLHEQSLHDSLITAIMPFTQQSLLNNLFRVNLNERKNGKLFRSMISRNNKALTKFPLVKGDAVLPFNVTSFQSRFISLLLKKAGAGNKNRNSRLEKLKGLKSLIRELLNDKSIKVNEMYNAEKMKEFERLIDKNEGNECLWYEIDWWLAFESFRQTINLD